MPQCPIDQSSVSDIAGKFYRGITCHKSHQGHLHNAKIKNDTKQTNQDSLNIEQFVPGRWKALANLVFELMSRGQHAFSSTQKFSTVHSLVIGLER